MGRIRKAGALSVALCAAVGLNVVGASPAFAGENRTVVTRDDNPGGNNTWYHDGDRWQLCDTQADGLRVWGRAWVRRADGTWNLLGTMEFAGGVGDCGPFWNQHDVIEGRQVKIRVCLKNGDFGAYQFCAERSDAIS